MSRRNPACTSRVASDNHILGDRQLGQNAVPDFLDRLKATLADRYALEREIGAGGMATVYLARDLKHDRPVAIKVLAPELSATLGTERFLNEIKVTANLQHAHILPLFDSGEADGLLYYVMPYVEGESLRDKLNRERQLSIEEALEITKTVASALDYAHRRDVIHRDIKPENILLHEGQAMVADFGIAVAVSAAGGARLTETGLSLGTPAYMSPEQATADRELDAKSDIYSLGCVTYEMLVGDPPFTGSNVQAIITKIVTTEPHKITLIRSTVPEHVEAAVHKALAKVPTDRFPTAAEFATALTTPVKPPWVSVGRRPVVATVVGAVALVLGIAAVGLVLRAVLGPETYAVENPRRSMVIFPFAVTAPDTSLDWLADGAAAMLTTNLEGWQELRVVDRRQLAAFGRSLEIALDDVDLADALAVARRARVGTLLLGEVLGQAGEIEIVVRPYDVASGEPIQDPARGIGAAVDPRPVLDSIAAQILDISGAPVVSPDIRAATTSSLQAYREYVGGLRHLYRWELGEASLRFRAAIDEDSTFPLAYHRLALALSLQGERGEEEVRELTTAAVRHADRLPLREKQHVQAFNAFQHDDYELARRTYREIIATDSSDAEAWYHLGEVEFYDRALARRSDGGLWPRANWNAALRAFARAVEIDPGFNLGYGHSFDIYRWAWSCQWARFQVPDADVSEREGFAADWQDSLVWVRGMGDPSGLHRGDSVVGLLRERYIAIAKRWVNAAPDVARAHAELRNQYIRRPRTLNLALDEDRSFHRISQDTTLEGRFRLVNLYLANGIYDTALALAEEGLASLPSEPDFPKPALWAANIFIARGQPSRALEIAAGERTSDSGTSHTSSSGTVVDLTKELPVLRAIEILGSSRARRPELRTALDSLVVLLAPPRHTQEEIDLFNEIEDPVIEPALLVLEEDAVRAWYAGRSWMPVWARAYLQFRADSLAAASRTIEQGLGAWRELQELNDEIEENPGAERTFDDLTEDAERMLMTLALGTAPSHYFLMGHVAQTIGLDSLALTYYERMDPLRSQPRLSSLIPSSVLPYAILKLDGDWGLLSLSYLERAQSYEALGDSTRAIEYYERFLEIWRDAEPDLQHYNEEARRGLTRLRGVVDEPEGIDTARFPRTLREF